MAVQRRTDGEVGRVVFGKKFYYNLKTGRVEEGRQSAWTDLMGPYPTRDAAERALETARARTQEWDATEHGGSRSRTQDWDDD